MNNNNKKATIILIFIIVSFCLLCLLGVILSLLRLEEEANIQSTVQVTNNEDLDLITVLKKHETEYLSKEENKIYVVFGKDLYSEEGKSNKGYFSDLTEDVEQFFEKSSFYLIDEEKKIKIFAKYIKEDDDYEIIINDIAGFYENTDGDDYVEVEKTSIIKPSVLFISNGYLERLVIGGMYFSSIEKYVSEGEELEDGYISYPEQQFKVKLAPNKTVQNIIFFDDYEGNILSDINMKMSLAEILELHPDNSSGSLQDGYLGYRNGDLYYFFYKDEVSVYGYSYSRNKEFEESLTTYLEDKDLDKFVQKLKSKLKVYDEFKYDPDIKRLYMTFPTRGIEIDITDNDPRGITLYSNYFFTDTSKEFVKNGKVSLNSKVDLVQQYEKARRESR